LGALAREKVNGTPIAQASSACTLSYLVARKDMKAALVTTHREFQLGALESQPLAVSSAADGPVSRLDAPEQPAQMPIEQPISYLTSLVVDFPGRR